MATVAAVSRKRRTWLCDRPAHSLSNVAFQNAGRIHGYAFNAGRLVWHSLRPLTNAFDDRDLGAGLFCDPQSPWQRGTNEHINLLLRQYVPKGTNLSRYSQADLNRVALCLNQRPRKTLEYQTPAAILEAAVATTTCTHRQALCQEPQ